MSPQPPSLTLSGPEVAGATRSDPQNTMLIWPAVLEAMQERGCGSRASQIGMAATIAIETGHKFKPLHEYKGAETSRVWQDYQRHYWPSGYYGRGLIQRTWEANYHAVRDRHQAKFGVDVVQYPDELLDPEVAAWDAAFYWEDKKLQEVCDRGDWKEVRRRVNGRAMLHLAEFLECVHGFGVQINH